MHLPYSCNVSEAQGTKSCDPPEGFTLRGWPSEAHLAPDQCNLLAHWGQRLGISGQMILFEETCMPGRERERTAVEAHDALIVHRGERGHHP